MKPYTHPKDAGLKFQRVIGKKRWKERAVAKLAPHELDDGPEEPVRRQIEADIQDAGNPYLNIPENLYGWLKRMAAADHWQAKALLASLKDLQDFVVFRKVAGEPFTRALCMELKRGKGGKATPGQKSLATATGGPITNGYTEASAALRAFLGAA